MPIVDVRLSTIEIDSLRPDQYTVIGEKVSYRLAQQPGSYQVIRYTRPVIKRRDTDTLISVPAPMGVLEGSRADVSFCAGMIVDKFVYHLPLYRQHQKLCDSGIRVSRPWLTKLSQQVIGSIPAERLGIISVKSKNYGRPSLTSRQESSDFSRFNTRHPNSLSEFVTLNPWTK